MWINKDIHVIPYEKHYIMYVPNKGTALLVNQDTLYLLDQVEKYDINIDQLKLNSAVLEQLRNNGVIMDQSIDNAIPAAQTREFQSPTYITLFPTDGCNLRCRYCYASAGEITKSLSIDIAKAGIDFTVQNLLKLGKKDSYLIFHGGGEPLLAKDVLMKSIDYMRKLCTIHDLNLHISCATNGVLSNDLLEFIKNNQFRLTVSLDGTEDIQNKNRPFSNGNPTFKYVMNSINFFEKHNISYGIRSTITDESVNKMAEIFDLFSTISSNTKFHMEPLFKCGRCATSKINSPDPLTFVRKFLEVKKEATKRGKEIFFSNSRFSVRSTFCGALNGNFAITPEGDITSCYEVSSADDPRSNIFFWGKYNPKEKEKFEFYQNRIDFLQNRRITNINGCGSCVAKFSCAGDCPAKITDIYNICSDSERCQITKSIAYEQIKLAIQNVNEGCHSLATI